MINIYFVWLQFLAPFRVWELPNCNSLLHFASGNFPTAIPCSISRLGTSQLQFLVPFRVWELPSCNSLLHFASGNFPNCNSLLHFASGNFLTTIPWSISHLGTSRLQFLAPFLYLGTSRLQFLAPFRIWELPDCNSLFHFASGNFLTAIPCSISRLGTFFTKLSCFILHHVKLGSQ